MTRMLQRRTIQKKQKIFGVILLLCILMGCLVIPKGKIEAGSKTYKITTKTKPCDKTEKFSTYNKYTKHYYTLLSYLKRLEDEGGGTLELKKGTYTISNTLYVPSNVTIKLNDGVKIIKGKKSGTKKFSASKSIFQFCSYKRSTKKGAYKKYNGDHNISIIGQGKAYIDLNYDKDAVAIMMCHNKDITISGITFQNMYSGHFIEMDATKNVTVKECTFENHKDSNNNNKEAINLDTPDKETNGFHAVWTSYDKTPNENVLITKCTFNNLERSIGTHKYSENKLHKKIRIIDNKISNCDEDAIRVMNWSEPVIMKNMIVNVAKRASGKRAILASGVINPVITDNVFEKVSRPIQFMPWKNQGDGGDYDVIYNILSDASIELMKNNKLIDGDEYFIRINKIYNSFDKDTDKISLNIG